MNKKIKKYLDKNIDVNVDFSKIENKIDYPEVKNNFFKRHKVVTVFVSLLAAFTIFAVGEPIYVKIYNNNVDAYNENLKNNLFNNILDLKKIDNVNDAKRKIIRNKTKKDPWYDRGLFVEKNGNMDTNTSYVTGAVGEPGDNSIETNTHEKGIDESDYKKCDGEYIYSITNKKEGDSNYLDKVLNIYNLEGNLIDSEIIIKHITKEDIYNPTMYIYKNYISVIDVSDISIFSFDGREIKTEYKYNLGEILDTRLYEGNLYIISENGAKKFNQDLKQDIYYDTFSYTSNVYSINKFSFTENKIEEKEVKNVNYEAYTYMSKDYIVIASNNSLNGYGLYTTLSIFDKELNPVCVINVEGYIYSHFAIKEKDGLLYIVTSLSQRVCDKTNRLTIFDLKTKEKISCLNENIGIGTQIVKSVRYEDDCSYVYICTYENKDPLYKIDISDPENPYIVSREETPGFSTYIHNFKQNNNDYIFTLGLEDDQITRKITIYKNGETLEHLSTYVFDFSYSLSSESNTLICDNNFINYKSYFFYEEETALYFGIQSYYEMYTLFKIDVNNPDTITLKEKYLSNDENTRVFKIENKLYIVGENVIIDENVF